MTELPIPPMPERVREWLDALPSCMGDHAADYLRAAVYAQLWTHEARKMGLCEVNGYKFQCNRNAETCAAAMRELVK